VTLAALLLPLGALGDRYGRRFTLVSGIALFSAASGVAAFASSGGVLIAARAIMGIGAAAAMPGTLSTITSVFPPESRAKAVGLWAGFAGAGGTLGMVLSGALLQNFWWGSVFLLNVALGGVTLAMIVAAVPSTRATEPVGLDPKGSALSIVGFGLLVLGIIEGPERGWTDPVTVVGLVGGAIAIAAFVRAELASRAPLLDPRLFRLRGFATGTASLFLQFLAMFGFFFIAVQYLQLVLDYSALRAAVALLPMSVCSW
jgi:MFS family permease